MAQALQAREMGAQRVFNQAGFWNRCGQETATYSLKQILMSIAQDCAGPEPQRFCI